MTRDEFEKMRPQSAILRLAVLLAEKSANGENLTPSEQVISDISGIDSHVAPNGFYGWLTNLSCHEIVRTQAALREAGCLTVSALVQDALGVIGVNPGMTSDRAKNSIVNRLSESTLGRLNKIDVKYYHAVDACMDLCKQFVLALLLDFPDIQPYCPDGRIDHNL